MGEQSLQPRGNFPPGMPVEGRPKAASLNNHKWLTGPVRAAVYMNSEGLFANSRLANQQNRHIAGRDIPNYAVDMLHRRAVHRRNEIEVVTPPKPSLTRQLSRLMY